MKKFSPFLISLCLFSQGSAWAAGTLCSLALGTAKALSVQPFSQPGLSGKMLNSTDPFGLLPKGKFPVIAIDAIGNKTVPRSSVFWLKDPGAMALVKSLVDHQVPVVFGKIPQGTTADAFVISIKYQLAQDVLAAKGDRVHKNILFLQDTATKPVIAHETQHWLDYEDGTFAKLIGKLLAFQKKAKLSDGDFEKVQDAMVEQRGHARQEITMLEDRQAYAPADFNYLSTLYQPYAEKLLSVLNSLRAKSRPLYSELAALLQEFELKSPGNIRYNKFFKF